MKWIKHHTNASDTSEKLAKLIEHHGVSKYGEYWLLLEGLGSRFDGENTEIFISVHDAKSKLRSKNEKKLIETIQIFSNCALLTYKKEDKFLKIDCPILFELQDKHSKYNRKRVVSESLATTLEEDKKKKRKEVEEEVEVDKTKKPKSKSGPKGALELFKHSKPLATLLVTVPQSIQLAWVEHYGPEHIELEFTKAHIWLASNSKRNIKDVARFLGNWLINSEKNVSGSQNRGKKQGTKITPDNPTGNPYLQEAIDKGLTA